MGGKWIVTPSVRTFACWEILVLAHVCQFLILYGEYDFLRRSLLQYFPLKNTVSLLVCLYSKNTVSQSCFFFFLKNTVSLSLYFPPKNSGSCIVFFFFSTCEYSVLVTVHCRTLYSCNCVFSSRTLCTLVALLWFENTVSLPLHFHSKTLSLLLYFLP